MVLSRLEASKLDRNANVEISLSLTAAAAGGSKKKSAASVPTKSAFGLEEHDDDEEEEEGASQTNHQESRRQNSQKRNGPFPRRSCLEPNRKRKSPPTKIVKENWICSDILVRIISKELAGGKYFKRKGVIDRVLDDKFTCEVEILDSGPDERDGGDVLRLDQDDLETVVPKEGKKVRIVNGKGRGKIAKVVELDKKRYLATLKLDDGTILERVDYGDFSKAA